MVSFKPNKAPRGTPVFGDGSFTLPATSGTYTRYFSGAFDDPSDTVRYSITSSNPSLITFTNGTDVVSSQPVTVNVLQTVTSPTSVTCTITTKDKYNAVGVSNSITITVGQYANRLVELFHDSSFSFPPNVSQAIIYLQAQGGGGGAGGGGGGIESNSQGGAGSGGICGTPGNLMVAGFYGQLPTTPMTIQVGNATGLGGTGVIWGQGNIGSTGEATSISSAFLNVTANGGIGGNGGELAGCTEYYADGTIGSIPVIQSLIPWGSGSGTGWNITSYVGYINGSPSYATKSGLYLYGGAGVHYSNSISPFRSLFDFPYGAGGSGGSGANGALNATFSSKGGAGESPPTGIVRIEYIELV
jgi:hypothetical protein